ncbi:MAG: hypothetical protein AB7P69_02595 [Candidatus Binatia bacterium]
MINTPSYKVVEFLLATLIALVIGLLFAWWIDVVVLLAGLVFIFRTRRNDPMRLNKVRALDGSESGEWLEEWHDDMRRRQIGPYDWRD